MQVDAPASSEVDFWWFRRWSPTNASTSRLPAARRAGVPLTIVGDGPERAALTALAGDDVRFLGWCSNEEIRDLYRSSIATILPGEEDFGIVPLESQACGRPVVALGRGGALETVIDGETGILVEPGEEALADGLVARPASDVGFRRRFADMPKRSAANASCARFVHTIEDTMSAPAGQRW